MLGVKFNLRPAAAIKLPSMRRAAVTMKISMLRANRVRRADAAVAITTVPAAANPSARSGTSAG
jgi:hypothetical protein